MRSRITFVTTVIICSILAALAPVAYAAAEEKGDEREVRIERWLVLGPIAAQVPAFSGEEKSFDAASFLLGYESLSLSELRSALSPARVVPALELTEALRNL